MNGVHDMGGMHGHGPVAPEVDEPVFHAPWEARALAITLAAGAGGRWNIDMSRFEREQIPAADYLRMSYYERWIAGLEALLVARGLVTAEELASGAAAPGAAKASPPLTAERVPAMLERRGGYQREVDEAPRFAVGAAVLTRNLNPAGHVRLPRYARGKRGIVTRWHGAHVFPDANAMGEGEQPRHLYQVRFEASELWGDAAGRREAVYLDLWEPYLDAA